MYFNYFTGRFIIIDLTHAKYRAFKVWLWTGQNEFLKTVTNTVHKTPFEYDYKIPLKSTVDFDSCVDRLKENLYQNTNNFLHNIID